MKEQTNYWNNVTLFIKTEILTAFIRLTIVNGRKRCFKKIENQLRLYNDNPEVKRVYVIRKLDDLPVYLGWFAHSGLLQKLLMDGGLFVNMRANKNQVCLMKQPILKIL